MPILPEFCYRSATNLLQTTEKGASYTFHYQYEKVNPFHFFISKSRRYKKKPLTFSGKRLSIWWSILHSTRTQHFLTGDRFGIVREVEIEHDPVIKDVD